jgi:ABC-type phosphate transport system substrate-binding protein
MKIFALVSFTGLGIGLAASASEGEGPPKVERYVSRPLKAVTFIVDTKGNPSLTSISLRTLRKIYNCTLRNWKDVPGSTRTDEILPIALWEQDEATQFLQKRIPKFALGPCVTVITGPEPSRAAYYAIGVTLPNKLGVVGEAYSAIGYLYYGPLRSGQTPLAILDDLHGKKPAAPIAPSEKSVENRSYALVR